MRIGIDARMLGCSGIGRYTENLIREILEVDKENEYVVFVQKNQSKRFMNNLLNPKSKILNLALREVEAPIYSFSEQSNFLFAINREKLDIMHFTHFNRPIFYNRPSVVTIHDLIPIYFPGKRHKSIVRRLAFFLVLKTALKKARKIIAVSNYTKNDLIKNFPFTKDKIVVIYEGISEGFTNYDLGFKKFISHKSKILNLKPYLLYVGVWREHKNLKGLITAFEKLKVKNEKLKNIVKNLKLIIVGKPDPYYPEVEEMAKKSPFKKEIILAGQVSDSHLPSLYQNAECFVFPSFYEGFGLPPLEAMACRCPVVSSNKTSLPEILGEAALYFDPYDIEEMAEKILECLKDEKLKNSLIEKGKKQVKKYSWKKMAKETLKVYNKIGEERCL